MRIGYNAEIKGVRKGRFKYRFLVDHPKKPLTVLPFSVSHESEEESADPITKAQSGRVIRVQLPLPQTNHPQGLHLLSMLWSGTHALLGVDGVEAQVYDSPPKK